MGGGLSLLILKLEKSALILTKKVDSAKQSASSAQVLDCPSALSAIRVPSECPYVYVSCESTSAQVPECLLSALNVSVSSETLQVSFAFPNVWSHVIGTQ